VSYRYDECLLETPAGLEGVSPLAQLEAAGPEGVPCSWTFEVPRDMEGPVFVYAEIDGMYQNNRRYVQSRSDAQLRGEATEEIKYKKIKARESWTRGGEVVRGRRPRHRSLPWRPPPLPALHPSPFHLHLDLPLSNLPQECRPELYTDPLLDPDTADPDVVAAETIVPCGLVASSLFNDDYSVRVGEPDAEISIPLSVENIAWPSDKTRRFGDIPAQNSAAVPDGMPLNADERLIVWMRSATLSRFRKLWGILDVDLAEGDRVTVDIASRFDTYSFDGAKSVVLSTAGWMGGAGHVTGLLCIAVGLVSLFAAGGFALLVFLTPRTTGDLSHLSWNQEAAAAARAAAGGN